MELNKKNIITFIVVIILSALFIVIGNKTNQTQLLDSTSQNYYKAKVVTIVEKSTQVLDLSEGLKQEITTILFKAKVSGGPDRGKTITAIQTIDSSYAKQYDEVQTGSKIVLYHEPTAEGRIDEYSFAEYYRSDVLIIFVVMFLAIILILGRSKGFFTILSLIITVLAIFFVFLPAIVNSRNIYVTTIVVGVFIILMTLLLINGWNKKTLCAVLGNIGGIAVAGVIAIIMSKLLKVTGFIDEEYIFITTAELSRPMDLKALIWSGIMLGSLGAVMDVAMSIASAMNELSENMEQKTFKKMLKSGMNIGRDAIGTMTNTLILAYVGSSLATVLLLTMYSKNLTYLFNLEMIVVEVLQSIVGSLGILFAVPATALFASYIFTAKDESYLYRKKDDIGGIKI